jgi:hypothetical protein
LDGLRAEVEELIDAPDDRVVAVLHDVAGEHGDRSPRIRAIR